MFKKWGSLRHTHNLNDIPNNIKWSSVISLRYHYFWTQYHCTLIPLVLSWHSFYNCHKTAAPHRSTADKPMCHSYSQGRCCYLLWLECSQLLPLFFITWTAKLTFMPVRAKGFMCLSVTLGSRQYVLHLSISYSFSMSSHLVVLVSHFTICNKLTTHICYIMS